MANVTLQNALQHRRSVRSFAEREVPRFALEAVLWAAQGVTNADGRRTAPSANALHPLSLKVAVAHVTGLSPGLYAVGADGAPALIDESDRRPALAEAAIGDQPWVAEAPVVIAVCADFFAPAQAFVDQPPYGYRGGRYVHIEAGAVAQNMHLQAVAAGMGGVLVAGFHDAVAARALGVAPPIAPVCLFCMGVPKG